MITTGDYLDRIIPAVRRRLEERRERMPLAELRALRPEGTRASFAAAISAPGVSLVAEVKRASPSRGPIRPDLEVERLVTAYEAGGARAVSVLTEGDFFLGSLHDLRSAAAATTLPLLRKDFILDEYQLVEARVHGASAVLLIAALLGDEELRRLSEAADDLGLDVLLEVHDEAEMERALSLEKTLLGVNNRDLRSFSVSLEVTERLAPLVPEGRLLVSESGISSNEDVQRLASAGVDAVLVGESLLRETDVEDATRSLLGECAGSESEAALQGQQGG